MQSGDRLVIDVVASRGSERRHWQQVVKDSADTQSNRVIEELWVLEGDERCERSVCVRERGRSACAPFAVGNVDLLAPFRAGQSFACT